MNVLPAFAGDMIGGAAIVDAQQFENVRRFIKTMTRFGPRFGEPGESCLEFPARESRSRLLAEHGIEQGRVFERQGLWPQGRTAVRAKAQQFPSGFSQDVVTQRMVQGVLAQIPMTAQPTNDLGDGGLGQCREERAP